MKKSRDSITIYHDANSDNSEDDTAAVTPVSHSSTETKSNNELTNGQTSIHLSSMSNSQLTPSINATTNAILSLKNNPFFQDKRKWDDSFTVAEKKELTGNIVKAAKDNDGETYVTLQEEEYTILNLSHEDEDDSQESDDVDGSGNKKPGRKPLPDEDAPSDSDQDPKVKRKAQNRAAQRAFRERKERYVKELEAKIKQVQDANLITTTQLVRENQQLRSIIYRLETENYALKGIPMPPYQHQTTLSPQPPQPSQPSSRQNGSTNYPTIAPLLPQQQPLLLPAYLSSPSMPPSSVLQNSPSVNHMMMLASSPLQQYPMSPVISTNMTSNGLHSTSPKTNNKIPLPISKKVSTKKNNTSSPPVNNQPLEYTFSISTPASLRPSGGSVSSSKHSRTEPVELVQLYPPGGKRNTELPTLQKSDLILLSPKNKTYSATSVSSQGSVKVNTPNGATVGDDTSSIVSDKTSSSINTQQQRKKMQQLELDMFDCHIDTEGQLFCEKLYNEVCNDAFDRLLSEPLFDRMGKLNLSISSYPVPIVTGRHVLMEENNSEEEKEEVVLEKEEKEVELIVPSSPEKQKKLLTCPEIWYLLNQHEKVNNFTTEQLFQAVKEVAKCSDSGPVLEECDLQLILNKMNQGYL